MTQDPFSDNPNPYQSPGTSDSYTYQDAGNPLMVPAVALLTLATLTLLMLIATVPFQLLQIGDLDLDTPEGLGQLTGMIAALGAWSLMTIGVIIGSIGMLRLKGYSGAVTASIIAIIPICSPCYLLGIPFGIWALLVLLRPEVKSKFS